MLLRSASSPLLNCARAPPGAAAAEHLAVASPPRLSPAPAPHRLGAALCRAMSEGDLGAPVAPAVRGRKDDGQRTRQPLSASSSASFSVEEEVELEEEVQEEEEGVVSGAAVPVPLRRLLTSTGLLDVSAAAAREALALLEEGVGGGGAGDAADAHYRRMIEADPSNPLLLVNYARFLREVEGDAARAQEYCERAILASPGDAEALALYAGLVWETSRDAGRADDYYSRAVQAAPDDCYVLGSYAGFLWDAEEDDEQSDPAQPLPPLLGAQPPSVTAAS